MTTHHGVALWLTLAIGGVGTYLLRLSFIGLLRPETRVPAFVTRALRLVPPAILAALVTPGVFRPDAALDVFDARPVAATVAGLVAWRTRSVLATLVVGMVVLWALEAV